MSRKVLSPWNTSASDRFSVCSLSVSTTYSLQHLAPELVGVVQVLGLAVILRQVLLGETEISVVELEVIAMLVVLAVRVSVSETKDKLQRRRKCICRDLGSRVLDDRIVGALVDSGLTELP